MSPHTEVQQILVLEPDRLRAAVLAQTISITFPGARVYCETEPAVAATVLAEHAIDLFVVAVRGFDLDILTLLGVWAEHDANRTRVLVVTAEVNSTALMAVRTLPITGVFDAACGDLRELEVACRAVASGAHYWSPSVRAAMNAPALTAAQIGDDAGAEYVDTPLLKDNLGSRRGRNSPPSRPRRFPR